MKWGRYWPECLLVATILAANIFKWFHVTDASSPLKGVPGNPGWTAQRKLVAREKTRELWYHGFDSYMTYAFPLDELTPLSCSGQGPDWANPANIGTNDVLGNFSLTLIDVLDTFIVLDDRQGFETAVKNVIEWVSFDVNTKPQVFETTIRVLGGLLSGHIFANRTGPFHLPWYRGELLELAHDLGKRLLPAFATPTGIPYARINLRHGVVKGETLETCAAGAGSLILEFATLSRLTGDDRFEKAAYRAFFGIWNRKSDIGLVGNAINTRTGAWIYPEATGIGAGTDSFYEYALKWYILSGETEFLDVWDDAYATIMQYARAKDGYWYKTVNMHSGDVAFNTIDSLSAFWPGLQVLSGDIQSAIKLHMMYYNVWRQHSGLPEVYDSRYKKATSGHFALRPEFVESTWYLYRATRDPFYLDVGERIIFDISTRAQVHCGLTSIQDLRTNKLDDRMESFVLSETLKYLFLLFDEDNPLHHDDSNYVFTTEGHILSLSQEQLKPKSPNKKRMRNVDNHHCPAYNPFTGIFNNTNKQNQGTGLVQGVRSRVDVDYGRYLVGLSPNSADQVHWSPNGWCERPKVVDPYSYEFILASNGRLVAEDLSPSLLKLGVVPDGYIIHNVTGIRTQIVQRLDGMGYDIKRLGHYTVRPGQVVYINDSSIFFTPGEDVAQDELHRDAEIRLRIFSSNINSVLQVQNGNLEIDRQVIDRQVIDLSLTAYSAHFGADLSHAVTHLAPRIRSSEGVAVRRDPENLRGCNSYEKLHPDSVLLVHRGDCTFLEKLVKARDASAAGVIVISSEDTPINPTASREELALVGDLSDVGLLLLTNSVGQAFENVLVAGEQLYPGEIMLALERAQDEGSVEDTGDTPVDKKTEVKDLTRNLYINGHPLINTRLLV